MFKALVIGCGNIGALYDISNESILTHAKAFYLDDRFVLSVFDIDKDLVKRVKEKYNCEIVHEININSLKNFDCVSICTPTETHYDYILMCIKSGVKMIICEKPVSYLEKHLNDLIDIYKNSEIKILVNYMRRFQPSFRNLQDQIREIRRKEKITNISIRYQRGFLNNCSHALDIIEFLIESDIVLQDISKSGLMNDHFANDPTVSIQANWNGVNFNILGLTNVRFSFFEIDIYFESYLISLKDSGQRIEIYFSESGERYLLPLKIQEQFTQINCLKDHMKHVIDEVYNFLTMRSKTDNFIGSVRLNKRMLNYIK